jgi:hypothetical protein
MLLSGVVIQDVPVVRHGMTAVFRSQETLQTGRPLVQASCAVDLRDFSNTSRLGPFP